MTSKKDFIKAMNKMLDDTKVLMNLIESMPEDLQWELTRKTNGATNAPNTDPPN